MNYSEYKQEIQDLATMLIEENIEEANDKGDSILDVIQYDGLDHQVVDGHEWNIYYKYSLDIIKHSDNEDYMIDNLGSESLEHSLREGGLDKLHQAIAFYAMLADLNEELYKQAEKIEEI